MSFFLKTLNNIETAHNLMLNLGKTEYKYTYVLYYDFRHFSQGHMPRAYAQLCTEAHRMKSWRKQCKILTVLISKW